MAVSKFGKDNNFFVESHPNVCFVKKSSYEENFFDKENKKWALCICFCANLLF